MKCSCYALPTLDGINQKRKVNYCNPKMPHDGAKTLDKWESRTPVQEVLLK